MMDFFKPLLRHPARRVQSGVMRLNYLLGNYKKIIWLIGDGRSGTTWVSDLINWNKRYREMFEPFHPFVKDMKGLCLHQYIKPDSRNPLYSGFLGSVFSGKFRHHRVDRENYRLLYSGLLIKDIFANLFSPWVKNNFSHVKIISLVRNPFMVALSKYKKQEWIWMTDPKDFLLQKDLFQDFLAPHEDFIRGSGSDFIERQILIWAILHYVPLKQLTAEEAFLLFYEDLYVRPGQELLRLFTFTGESVYDPLPKKLLTKVKMPSRVSTGKNGVFKGRAALESWKDQLTTQQIDKGMKILNHFGLDKIYNGESMPKRAEMEKLYQQQ